MKDLKRPKRVMHYEVGKLSFLKYVDDLEAYANKLEKQLSIPRVVGRSEQLCECAMPDPIDPFDEVDKETCRKCGNKFA